MYVYVCVCCVHVCMSVCVCVGGEYKGKVHKEVRIRIGPMFFLFWKIYILEWDLMCRRLALALKAF